MAVQTHLELIFNKKFGDINSTLENIEASTDALLNRFYNKKTGLDDEIKTYLTKKFNEVNTKNYENMLALYDKLQERAIKQAQRISKKLQMTSSPNIEIDMQKTQKQEEKCGI
ncbi:hypothetical protein RhiirC2_783928 [Rhizophagus irregularis]|uniref:Uncharacterized protein n=1 Tax=Rhizophagus irregularis TaxID=588596 RepID=A0A2N1MZS8_9GLOM|nr:hypothetical protein RhiirC2_783928 [Rhizophagus irregularis]